MRPVDKQVQLLYDAQFEAFKGTALDSPLGTSECLGYNNILFNRAREKGYWLGEHVPPMKFVAQLDNQWSGQARWYWTRLTGCDIQLTPSGKRGWVIAHEAAHILLMAGRPEREMTMEGHGKEYAAVFIWAVSALFGIKWSNRLKRAFAEARVEAVCSLKED